MKKEKISSKIRQFQDIKEELKKSVDISIEQFIKDLESIYGDYCDGWRSDKHVIIRDVFVTVKDIDMPEGFTELVGELANKYYLSIYVSNNTDLLFSVDGID